MQTLFKTLMLTILSAVFFLPTPGYANITITPTRVVFEDGERFAHVTLVNTSDETKTYEMTWEFYHMQETGSPYKPIKQSITAFDLSKHIMFTPRRVTLPASGKQKIRLALRRPAEVAAGEYRAHLSFKPLQEADLNQFSDNTKSGQPQSTAATVTINVGYSIPVIFRAGQSDVQAQIENMALNRNPQNNKLEALVSFVRTGGPYGVLGHLFIYHDSADGEETLVGEISNAHIFPEVNRREMRVPMTVHNIAGGALRVVFKDYRKGSSTIFDERTFPLN